MEENTVFQGSTVNPQAQNIPSQNSQTPPPLPPDQDYQSPPQGRFPSFSVGTIIKIVIGLGTIALILFIVFAVILPLFSTKTVEKPEITYWGLWEDKNTVQSIIDEFNKKYPDIKVNYVKQDLKKYREKLSARFDNEEKCEESNKDSNAPCAPDVFLYHNSWFPMFSSDLTPIPEDTISKEDFKKSFFPVVEKDLIRNGAIYGIPTGIDTLALYVNREIFDSTGEAVPNNWDDFYTISRHLTVKDEEGRIKTSGAALGTFNNIDHASDIISMLFVQNGANMNDLSSTSNNASDALEFYTSYTKGDESVWDNSLENSKRAFSAGKVAMYFGYSWDYFEILANNPDLKIEIHPVPEIKDKDMSIASYWVAGVSSGSKFKKEALLFHKFLTSKESQEKMYTLSSKTRLFGQPYARRDMAEKLKDSIPYQFAIQGNKAVSTNFASDTYDDGINSKLNKYLENAVNSMISENKTSADSAVEVLSQGVSQVLSQYGQ